MEDRRIIYFQLPYSSKKHSHHNLLWSEFPCMDYIRYRHRHCKLYNLGHTRNCSKIQIGLKHMRSTKAIVLECNLSDPLIALMQEACCLQLKVPLLQVSTGLSQFSPAHPSLQEPGLHSPRLLTVFLHLPFRQLQSKRMAAI